MKWVAYVKIKEKGTVHKHCTLVEKVFPPRLTIQKPLYVYNGIEQLSKGWWLVGAKFPME